MKENIMFNPSIRHLPINATLQSLLPINVDTFVAEVAASKLESATLAVNRLTADISLERERANTKDTIIQQMNTDIEQKNLIIIDERNRLDSKDATIRQLNADIEEKNLIIIDERNRVDSKDGYYSAIEY